MKMHVNVTVMGGLCSRLRAVSAAAIFAQQKQLPLRVFWPKNEDYLQTFGGFTAQLRDMFDHNFTEVNTYRHAPKQLQQDGAGWNIRTCHPEDFAIKPIEKIGKKLKEWPLSPTVLKRSLAILAQQTQPELTVGVHIRQWVKQPGSPGIDWYVERMRELLNINPKILFFLSCDSRSVSTGIRSMFSGSVIEQYKADYSYDQNGIIASCADLFVLEKCRWVIGASHSSYSQMVAFMRGAKYTGRHDEPNGILGGDYEDAWNPPDHDRLMKAIA